MPAAHPMTALDARRQQQVPQAFARITVVLLFIGLWLVLWLARIPLPVPFLVTLLAEAAFFIAYWRIVYVLPSVRAITLAHYVMLAVEISFHTTIVYFLGGIAWLGAFAYMFGLIFTNMFLSLRGGLVYTTAAASAFVALAMLDGTGVIPHYDFLAQDVLRYQDERFVVTTVVCGTGVFYCVYLWINWVGAQLRAERDAAVAMRDDLFGARAALQRANAELEQRVRERTSALVAANGSLEERDALLRATIESTADGILVVDAAGNVVYHNQRFLSMWRIPPELAGAGDDALLNRVLDQLEDPDAFLAKVRDLYRSDADDLDLLRFKDGRAFERYSRPLLRDGNVAGRVWSFRDVTEREQAAADLRRRARIDALTRTLNHGAITEELSAMVQSAPGRRTSVVMADVDAMKAVNDAYGHQAGDAMLLAVARALEAGDAVVGRYGGDEFVALLPGATRADAEAYCLGVMEALRSSPVCDIVTGSTMHVQVSMGIAVYPDEAASLDELLRSADAAMYAAKRERRMASAGALPRMAHGDERAARIVGELVPVLTLPGDLDAKLRLVAHRLSTVAGYEVVRFKLFAEDGGSTENTFARVDDQYVREFDAAPDVPAQSELLRLVTATRRPVVVDDLGADPRVTPARREIARRAGIRSALIVPMLWEDELIGVMSVATKEASSFDPRDIQLVTAVADQVTAIIRMERLVGDLQDTSSHLQRARADTVVLLAASAEAHDSTTGRHLQRVRAITEALARELGYDDDAAAALGLAAVLHDIGKIRVPDAILLSPAQLSDDEWSIMKLHTTWGAEFLRERPGFELAATIAAAHHERWDGSGYPRGLAGHQIPEAATIVAVADSLDAMTHDRPYRVGRPLDWAIEEVRAGAGTQFNPRVVDALLRIHARGDLAPFSHALTDGARAA